MRDTTKQQKKMGLDEADGIKDQAYIIPTCNKNHLLYFLGRTLT